MESADHTQLSTRKSRLEYFIEEFHSEIKFLCLFKSVWKIWMYDFFFGEVFQLLGLNRAFVYIEMIKNPPLCLVFSPNGPTVVELLTVISYQVWSQVI